MKRNKSRARRRSRMKEVSKKGLDKVRRGKMTWIKERNEKEE
jgi:hypothetical protein